MVDNNITASSLSHILKFSNFEIFILYSLKRFRFLQKYGYSEIKILKNGPEECVYFISEITKRQLKLQWNIEGELKILIYKGSKNKDAFDVTSVASLIEPQIKFTSKMDIYTIDEILSNYSRIFQKQLLPIVNGSEWFNENNYKKH